MRMPSVKLCAVFLTACAIAGPASPPARAGFITNFDGNVQISNSAETGNPSTPKGVVSFAVFQLDPRSAGNIIDQMNTALGLTGNNKLKANAVSGGTPFDAGATFLYLYQAYTKVGGGDIVQVQITANAASFTSGGYLTNSAPTPVNSIFKDTAAVGTSTDTGLGTDPTVGDVKGDNKPDSLVVSGSRNQAVDVTTNSAAKRPNGGVDLSGDGGFDSFFFLASLPGGRINADQTSALLFLTSRHGPVYDVTQLHDGGTTAGDTPTALTPEPGSLVLCGLGVSFLGFYGWRRRGLKAQPAVA